MTFLKRLPGHAAALLALLAVSCSSERRDPTAAADWRPERASVARHITSAHQFTIAPSEEAHLRVENQEGMILATFRDDVLEELDPDRALHSFGWKGNPELISRHEYLYFLEALHAYLVLYAPKWDGGENPARQGPEVAGKGSP